MKIYGAPLSPFVRKVIIYCVERQIDFDLIPIFPMGPDAAKPEFVAASPMGKIPAMDDDGFALADSSAIIHYLEAKHGAALLPEDAQARGTAVFFDEIADTVLVQAAGALFFNRVVAPKFMGQEGDQAAADLAEKETIPAALSKLEPLVPDAQYLVGDSLSLADIALASVFVNARHGGVEVDAARYPRTAKWLSGIWELPSFVAQLEAEKQALAHAGR